MNIFSTNFDYAKCFLQDVAINNRFDKTQNGTTNQNSNDGVDFDYLMAMTGVLYTNKVIMSFTVSISVAINVYIIGSNFHIVNMDYLTTEKLKV